MRSPTEPNLESVVGSSGDEGWNLLLIERINYIFKNAAVRRWPHWMMRKHLNWLLLAGSDSPRLLGFQDTEAVRWDSQSR